MGHNDLYKIRPVKTEYSGVLFRSRLEAIWANHFDGIGCEWTYEPMCVLQKSGSIYTPDFLLKINGGRHFVEIKPSVEHLSKKDCTRICDFINGSLTENDVFSLYIGNPEERKGRVLYHFGSFVSVEADPRCKSFAVLSLPIELLTQFLEELESIGNTYGVTLNSCSDFALMLRVVDSVQKKVLIFKKFVGLSYFAIEICEKYGEWQLAPTK